MTLRRHRRDVVIWRASRCPEYRGRGLWFTQAGRSGRIRRWVRVSGLLVAVGVLRVAAAVRPRWRPLAAGTVLTVAGFMMRSGMPGIVMIPGMLFLTAALLAPADPAADDPRRRALERELAAYSTPAQRRDLDAILDRYPDGDTRELRDILARQRLAAETNRPPATIRH
ncbi:MAG TPA: hypothetical protein VFV73_16880 [Streptosporangiaceae bacterium]|nr:hypothetical protein [Streptosporangiaceae bacterium]